MHVNQNEAPLFCLPKQDNVTFEGKQISDKILKEFKRASALVNRNY